MPDRENGSGSGSSGISGWFVQNHVAANLLMFFLVAGGMIAIFSMRSELFPTINPRTITVTVAYPGATPQEVEDGITRRVEEAVMGTEGVKKITSVAQENAGIITIEVEEFVDTDDVLNDVETAVDRLVDFPPRNAEAPIVAKISPQPFVITLVLYGEVPELTLKRWAERLQDEMLQTPGISLIDLRGDRDYEISIEIPEENLRKYDLSIESVGRRVAQASLNLPAGTVESASGDILLRIQEKGYHAERFEEIVIKSRPDGSLLRLKDIAEIVDGFADQNLMTRYNGKPAIFIQISRSEAQDTLKVEQAVQKYLATVSLPKGLELAVLENQTVILKQRMNLLARNAIVGFALVFAVLLLFLDLRLAVWTSLGIPISFLGGLLLVFLFGLSFNMVTLFALIVVLGIVVDDAIVTGESIFAEQEADAVGQAAAIQGVRAIRAPVSIGVFTTVAAFAPLAFSTGTLGQILRPIPIFVISILVVSLVEAFTILPAHLSTSRRWSRGVVANLSRGFNRRLSRFVTRYLLPAVRMLVQWRYAVLAGLCALVIVVIGLFRGGFIRFIFFPQIEGDQVTARLVMPVGTPYSVTRRNAMRILEAAHRVEDSLQEKTGQELFESTSVIIGSTFLDSSGPPEGRQATVVAANKAELRIQLIPAPVRDISAKEVETRLKKAVGRIPNADELTFQSSLVQGGEDINIQLAHENVDVLNRAAEALKDRMEAMQGVVEIADTLKSGKLEYVFRLTKAGLATGLTPADLGRQLRNAFYGYEVQRLQRERAELKVMVRYPKEGREQIRDVQNFRVTLPNGAKADLATMARIIQQRSQARITRVNGKRVVNVTADVDPTRTTPGEATAAVMSEVIPDIAASFPDLTARVEGRSRDRQEDLATLGRNMLVALLIIFVLLGAQLRSYVQPLIIMAIIPFGIVGAVLGHLVLGYNLSFISIFGVVALTGVVINDSVVLIDYYNQRLKKLKADGTTKSDSLEALEQAVQRRFRPILLTTLTTSLALLPMLLETSLQARFLIPMAISLAFGLMFASSIMFVLLPALILVCNDLRRWGRR